MVRKGDTYAHCPQDRAGRRARTRRRGRGRPGDHQPGPEGEGRIWLRLRTFRTQWRVPVGGRRIPPGLSLVRTDEDRGIARRSENGRPERTGRPFPLCFAAGTEVVTPW